MVAEQLLVERTVSRIEIRLRSFFVVFAQSPAPGVGRLIGETLCQTPVHDDIHRMIRRVRGIGDQVDRTELRIHHDEVVRQTPISEKPAVDIRAGRISVQEICQCPHVSVRQHRARR